MASQMDRRDFVKTLTQAQARVSASDGKYELYKTTTNFDGTQQHPEWLG